MVRPLDAKHPDCTERSGAGWSSAPSQGLTRTINSLPPVTSWCDQSKLFHASAFLFCKFQHASLQEIQYPFLGHTFYLVLIQRLKKIIKKVNYPKSTSTREQQQKKNAFLSLPPLTWFGPDLNLETWPPQQQASSRQRSGWRCGEGEDGETRGNNYWQKKKVQRERRV